MSDPNTLTPKPQSAWARVAGHFGQERAAREQARAVAQYEGHGVVQWVWDRWVEVAREQACEEVREHGLGTGRLALEYLLNATHEHVVQIAAREAERIEHEQQAE